ncbi:hypothetical protein D3C72_2094520 [compost metagenome]
MAGAVVAVGGVGLGREGGLRAVAEVPAVGDARATAQPGGGEVHLPVHQLRPAAHARIAYDGLRAQLRDIGIAENTPVDAHIG